MSEEKKTGEMESKKRYAGKKNERKERSRNGSPMEGRKRIGIHEEGSQRKRDKRKER